MVTFQIRCPHCGQTVEVRDPGFAATTVLVAPCDEYKAGGITGWTLPKSAAFAAEVVGEDLLVHKAGLVAFGA